MHVSFNKLLLPKGTIPISHAMWQPCKSKHKHRTQVEDLATWLEAWRRYLLCQYCLLAEFYYRISFLRGGGGNVHVAAAIVSVFINTPYLGGSGAVADPDRFP